MNKQFFLITLTIGLLLTACCNTAEKTTTSSVEVTEEKITTSSEAPVLTQAQPTSTYVPPTRTPSPTIELTPTPASLFMADPRLYVLPIEDMPSGFSYILEDTGTVSNEFVAQTRDNPDEFLTRIEEWGRVDGFSVYYENTRAATPYVQISVVIMAAPDGAQDYFEYLRGERIQTGGSPVSVPNLADGSYAFTTTFTDAQDNQIREYEVSFIKRNVIGTTRTWAMAHTANFDDALTYAKKLVSRISEPPPETVVPAFPTRVPLPTSGPDRIEIEETQTLGPIWNSTHDENYTVEIALHEVRFNSGDEWGEPREGYVYALVDLSVSNLGPGLLRNLGWSDFQMRDGNGVLRDSESWLPGTDDCWLEFVDLSPDGSIRGCVGFEVPMEGSLELIYAPYQYEALEEGRYLSFTIRP